VAHTCNLSYSGGRDIRRITVQSQPRQIVRETLSQKTLSQKIGLVNWLKVKALSSSLTTTKKEKTIKEGEIYIIYIINPEK
jgi:hypothetical protein